MTTIAVAVSFLFSISGCASKQEAPAAITIKGVEYRTELTELDLSGLDLTDDDIEPLKYMINLTILYPGTTKPAASRFNRISDISMLKGINKFV